MNVYVLDVDMQVLKEKFPGVRLSHDVCSVEALPEVRLGGLGSVEDQDACTLYLNRYDGVIVVSNRGIGLSWYYSDYPTFM